MIRSRHRIRSGLLATSVALCLMALGSGIPSAAGPSPCDHGWQQRRTPFADTTALYGVKVLSSDDVWAVGVNGMIGHQPIAEHWDGAEWRVAATPEQRGMFTAVSGTTSDDVWAVGQWNAHGDAGALTEHWDGTRWSIVRAPSPYPESWLSGVKAFTGSDVWAVGEVIGGSEPFIEHWDGFRWEVVRAATLDRSVVMTAVDGAAPDDVWAVGHTYSGLGVPVILHWDGSTWTRVPAEARPRGTQRTLMGVAAAAAGDVWAVGDRSLGAFGYEPYYLHWDGTGWRRVKVPGSASGGRLAAVATGPRSGWAVGGYGSGAAGTITEQRRGEQWRRMPSPTPNPGNSALTAVSISPDGATWAVGYGNGALALQWCPSNPP